MAEQLRLFEEPHTASIQVGTDHVERRRIEARFVPLMRGEPRLATLVSYVGNKTVPVLRLYRSQQMGRYGRVPVRESVVVWRRRGHWQ